MIKIKMVEMIEMTEMTEFTKLDGFKAKYTFHWDPEFMYSQPQQGSLVKISVASVWGRKDLAGHYIMNLSSQPASSLPNHSALPKDNEGHVSSI